MRRAYHVCVVRPEGYSHALAFLELAELLVYAIEDVGHACRLGFNTLDRRAQNIVIGAHLFGEAACERLPEGTILLNTEQLGASGHGWTAILVRLAKRLETWDYSTKNMKFLASQDVFGVRALSIGYHPRLDRLRRGCTKDIDVLFYGSIGPRRQRILNALAARGLTIKSLFGVYGAERDAWIERSKLVVNIHHYDTSIFEIVRVFYLLTNGVATVAEVGPTTTIDAHYLEAVVAAPYDGLVESCLALLRDEEWRERQGERARECIRARPQAALIEPLLQRP